MGRGFVLGVVAAAATFVACGAVDNSWDGDEVFTGNANAWYLDYPETENSTLASAIDAPSFGVAMTGDRATVSMNDMTCGVHVDTGSVFFDLDLRTGEIQDGVTSSDDGKALTSLLVAPPLVTLIPIDQPLGGEQFLVRGIRQARLLDSHSFVALSQPQLDGACEIRWFEDGQLDHKVTFDDSIDCSGDLGFAVDRRSGDAWVATPSGVFDVVEDEPIRLPVDGDLLAWDASSRQLYVASRGSSTVSALVDGQVAWTMDLPGEIVDLDDAGAPGGLVVVHADGLAHSVVRFDATGAELDHLSFDRPVLDVEISDGGDIMAVSRMDDHGYYRIR